MLLPLQNNPIWRWDLIQHVHTTRVETRISSFKISFSSLLFVSGRIQFVTVPLAYAQLIMNVSNLSGFCTSVPMEAKWDIKKRARKSFPIFNLRPLSFRDFPYFWNDFLLQVNEENRENATVRNFGSCSRFPLFLQFPRFKLTIYGQCFSHTPAFPTSHLAIPIQTFHRSLFPSSWFTR